jgi:hypothetical protein
MRKLMLCAALLMPLTSCGALSTVLTPPESCRVPVLPPAPALNPQACGELVCITVDEAKALAKWGQAAKELNHALSLCPEVVRY